MKKMTYPLFYAGEKQNYAAAVVAGDLVFCSGMTSRLPETGRTKIEGVGIQAWDALDKIKHNLEEAGTSLENIVRLDFHYVSDGDMTFFEGPSVLDYFRKNAPSLAEDMPAVTVVGLKSLRNPEQRAQIEVVAVTPEAKPKVKKYPLFYAGEKQNYAAAVVAGDLVFVSGMSGRLLKTGRVELGDRAIQTVGALANIKQILEEAGTSLDNIVSIDRWDLGRDGLTILDNVIANYARQNAPRLAEDMPCVTGVGAKSLCYPEELIVIEPIAVMPEAEPKVKVYPSIWAGKKANYANSVAVGDLVFVSGAGGRQQDTKHVRSMSPVVQAWDSLDKLAQRLKEAGTSLENVVYMRCFCVGDMGEMLWDGAIMDYFRKNAPSLAEDMPAVTIVGLNNLCVAEMLVEIEVIAVMPN